MPAQQLETEQIPRSELYEINLDSQSTSMLQQYSLPEYGYEERSWDFMPPDIARPLASTTVSDIAICAVRLGMRWKDFRPMDGSLIAEGQGQTLISTHVRSIGLILNYTFDTYKNQTDTDKSFWVPSGIADRFIFGIMPSPFKSLCEGGLELGTVTDIYATFSIISPSGSLQTALREYQESDPQRIPGISDLFCMTCPMLRIYGSPIDQVPQPFKSIFGPMSSASGLRAFHSCLHSFVSSTPKSASAQARWILQCCDTMHTRSQSWQSPSFLAINGGQVEVIDTYQRQFAKTTLYIQDFCHATYTIPFMTDAEGIQGLSLYEALLLEHMHQAIVIAGEVRQEKSKIKAPRDDVYFEEMWKYFENNFSRLCSSLSGLAEKNVLIDLWLTLVYRGFCWAQCHSISTTSAHYTVSAKYYNSQMPVYIG